MKIYWSYFKLSSGGWSYRYKQHKTDFDEIPSAHPILVPCCVAGCQCSSYHYVPLNGTQPIRCTCKHFTDDHSERRPYKCLKGCSCKKFWSAFTCSCGNPAHSHTVSSIFSLQIARPAHILSGLVTILKLKVGLALNWGQILLALV